MYGPNQSVRMPTQPGGGPMQSQSTGIRQGFNGNPQQSNNQQNPRGGVRQPTPHPGIFS